MINSFISITTDPPRAIFLCLIPFWLLFNSLWVFYISVGLWPFTGVWVRAGLMSPGLFWAFRLISVWVVSILLVISSSLSPFSKPPETVPRVSSTTGIIVNLIFHPFFSSLARSKYLSTVLLFKFIFSLWSDGTAKSSLSFLFSFLLIITRSGFPGRD